MPQPYDVLEQLLSKAQANTLARAGDDSWSVAAGALEAVLSARPEVSELNARLAMPEELIGEFSDEHIVVQVEVATNQGQQATGYVVLPTSVAALFFDARSDDAAEQAQQTATMASTVGAQITETFNSEIFAGAPTGIAVSIGDVTPGAMPDLLAGMEEPCLALSLSLQAARLLPVSLIFPGAFLEIVAVAYEAIPDDGPISDETEDPGGIALGDEDLESAEPGDDIRTAQHPEPKRNPTPIDAAPTAQRAQFGPLPEVPGRPTPSNIDLLSDLQMQISVELGRTSMAISDVLALGSGSVVELDRLAGEPVDILVNDRVVARGEVVVVDENFGVRIVEVLPRARGVGKAS